MQVSFETSRGGGGTLVLGVAEGPSLAGALRRLDALDIGARETIAASRFQGRLGQILDLGPCDGFARTTLLGLGSRTNLDPLKCEQAGGRLAQHLNRIGETRATVELGKTWASAPARLLAAHLAFGASLACYRFDRYRTRPLPDPVSLARLHMVVRDAAGTRRHFEALDRLGQSILWVRDLVNEPPNILYPEAFADRALELEPLGVEVTILDETQLKAAGFRALLAVGRGSAKPSRLVTMRWCGSQDASPPIVFVGKGVTFDTGGISLKQRANMAIMKFDMAGAAAVMGLMRLLARRRAEVDAIGIIGLVENMPDGDAWRPGDVIRSLSGQTIEIIDTDAEGRMVLADALWHAVQTYRPSHLIDIATLTGAVMAALSYERAGLHSNDDALAARLYAAGETEGERLWRLPLGDDYEHLIESDIADMRNSGKAGWGGGDGAGSTTAAQFLQHFVAGTKWAHLDIPGVAWAHKERATCPVGPTGFGVRLLDRFVQMLEAEGR